MTVTSGADICQAVQSIIDADGTAAEIRTAVMSLISKEHHATHHQ